MWGVGCARLRRAGERAERAEAGDSGAERGEGTGQRERSGERETASPMVLHCVVGEKVAATFGDTEDLFPEGSFRGHYPRTCDKTTFWQ